MLSISPLEYVSLEEVTRSFSLKMLLVTRTPEQRECHLSELAPSTAQFHLVIPSLGSLAAPTVGQGEKRRRATMKE